MFSDGAVRDSVAAVRSDRGGQLRSHRRSPIRPQEKVKNELLHHATGGSRFVLFSFHYLLYSSSFPWIVE